MTIAQLVYEKVDNPNETGLSADSVKPITEQGVKVMVSENVAEAQDSDWSLLDQVWGGVQEGIGLLAGVKIRNELLRQGIQPTGVKVDTTGQVNDQPGGKVNETKTGIAAFYEKNKTPILIGAGLLALVGVVLLVKK